MAARKPTAKKNSAGEDTLVIKWVPTNSIHLNPRNPRENEKGVDKVAQSIKRFGWNQPIVVNADGTIIAGNTRYKAAIRLGLDTVPTTLFTGTKEQENAYLIADNKVRDYSTWVDEQLGALLAELDDEDIAATGFTERELEKLLMPEEQETIKDEEGGTPAKDDELGDFNYRILVTCKDEAHQAELIAQLEAMGLGDAIQAQML